jgi:hypothetical protein
MNAKEQRQAFDWFDCDAGCAVISRGPGHSGHGFYVWCSEYPDEGAAFLGKHLCKTLERVWKRRTPKGAKP